MDIISTSKTRVKKKNDRLPPSKTNYICEHDCTWPIVDVAFKTDRKKIKCELRYREPNQDCTIYYRKLKSRLTPINT